jgi:hypothetical protein
MGFQSKKVKSVQESYRRTRLKESTDVEDMHMQLLKAGERIEELRADMERKQWMKESRDCC